MIALCEFALTFVSCRPVPTTSVVIYDKTLKPVDKVAGPFEEDSSVSLICDSDQGKWPAGCAAGR